MVGAEEVLDAPQIFLDAEQQVAGSLAFKEYATGWHILLKLLDVVQDAMPYLGIPVVVGRGVWAAEGDEELREDSVCGISSCCRCGEGFWGRERMPAGGGSHGLKEMEAVPVECGVAETWVVVYQR